MRLRGGLPEVPCAKCERRVAGLAWGELCPRLPRRAAAACNPAGPPHLPRGDGADGGCTSRSACPAIRWRGSTGPSRCSPPTSSCGGSRAASPWSFSRNDHRPAWPALARAASARAPPLARRRPDVAHHLQRRPRPGAADGAGRACPRARQHPARRRLARSIRPRSFSLDSGVTITGCRYDGAVDEGSVLRRSVGRRVVFRLPESKDTLSALVLGVDPLRLQLPDGRVTFSPPGAAIYPGRRRGGRPDRRARAPERQGAGPAPAGLLHRRRDLAGQLSGDARRPDGAR